MSTPNPAPVTNGKAKSRTGFVFLAIFLVTTAPMYLYQTGFGGKYMNARIAMAQAAKKGHGHSSLIEDLFDKEARIKRFKRAFYTYKFDDMRDGTKPGSVCGTVTDPTGVSTTYSYDDGRAWDLDAGDSMVPDFAITPAAEYANCGVSLHGGLFTDLSKAKPLSTTVQPIRIGPIQGLTFPTEGAPLRFGPVPADPTHGFHFAPRKPTDVSSDAGQ